MRGTRDVGHTCDIRTRRPDDATGAVSAAEVLNGMYATAAGHSLIVSRPDAGAVFNGDTSAASVAAVGETRAPDGAQQASGPRRWRVWRGNHLRRRCFADADNRTPRQQQQRDRRLDEGCGGRVDTRRQRRACLDWCWCVVTRRVRRVGFRQRGHRHATHLGGAGSRCCALAHRNRTSRPARQRRELEREESDGEGQAPENLHDGKIVRTPRVRSHPDSVVGPRDVGRGVTPPRGSPNTRRTPTCSVAPVTFVQASVDQRPPRTGEGSSIGLNRGCRTVRPGAPPELTFQRRAVCFRGQRPPTLIEISIPTLSLDRPRQWIAMEPTARQLNVVDATVCDGFGFDVVQRLARTDALHGYRERPPSVRQPAGSDACGPDPAGNIHSPARRTTRRVPISSASARRLARPPVPSGFGPRSASPARPARAPRLRSTPSRSIPTSTLGGRAAAPPVADP